MAQEGASQTSYKDVARIAHTFRATALETVFSAEVLQVTSVERVICKPVPKGLKIVTQEQRERGY